MGVDSGLKTLSVEFWKQFQNALSIKICVAKLLLWKKEEIIYAENPLNVRVKHTVQKCGGNVKKLN